MARRLKLLIAAGLAGLALLLCACSQATDSTLKNGYYTAEASSYHHGWMEFVTIYVRNDTIVTVEYNAKNSSGFIKSWDMAYMSAMNQVSGTYPNAYTRAYAADFLEKQSADNIDAISGASTSYNSFQQLAAAAIEQSKAGDPAVAVVDIRE